MQSESLDDNTRTDLWNFVFKIRQTMRSRSSLTRYAGELTEGLWANHFRRSLSNYTEPGTWTVIQQTIADGTWVEVLSMIESMVKTMRKVDSTLNMEIGTSVRDSFNRQFEIDMIGYRFVENELVRVSAEVEVEAIEAALANTADLSGAQTHLMTALTLLSVQGGRQFAKSLAESVSAVEAIVRHLTGAATLGAGVKLLQAKGVEVHPALVDGWSKFYGYASDENGVRHGSIEESKIDEPLATYFLVTCSAFVNLLIKLSVEKPSE